MSTQPPQPSPFTGFWNALASFVGNFAYGLAVALGAYIGWAAGAYLLGLL